MDSSSRAASHAEAKWIAPPVKLDVQQLLHIVSNLFLNSVKSGVCHDSTLTQICGGSG
jgi:hypothetical protein